MINKRFSDAPWYDRAQNTAITIIGCGGIGSWFTFFASRAGFNIYLQDPDSIEQHNIGGQMFSIEQVTESKVIAIRKTLKKFSPENWHKLVVEISDDVFTSNITILALDSIKARKKYFEHWVTTNSHKPDSILIDGRLEAEQFQIFCIKTQEDIDKYREILDIKIEDKNVQCNYQQTTHVASMIASFMVQYLLNHVANIAEQEDIYDVPFNYELVLPILFNQLIRESKNFNIDGN